VKVLKENLEISSRLFLKDFTGNRAVPGLMLSMIFITSNLSRLELARNSSNETFLLFGKATFLKEINCYLPGQPGNNYRKLM